VSVLAFGEAVWPRLALQKSLPSRYESAFEIRQFTSVSYFRRFTAHRSKLPERDRAVISHARSYAGYAPFASSINREWTRMTANRDGKSLINFSTQPITGLKPIRVN
jgi:hypothetical protein